MIGALAWLAAAVLVTRFPSEPPLAAERQPSAELRPAAGQVLWRSDTSEQAQDAEQKGKKPRRFRWEDHPSFRFGRLRLDIRARVQLDSEDSQAPTGDDDDEEEESGIDVARRRIGVDGTVSGLLDFQIERELTDEESWRDVYVNYRQFAEVQVQAGKFKLPFSLDENTSATNLDFVHRSLAATRLAPGRDWGAMVHGRVLRRAVRYELGLFQHDGRNAWSTNPDRSNAGTTFAARAAVQPFVRAKTPAEDLQAAIAFTSSDAPDGFFPIRGRTVLGARFFDPDYYVLGRRQRVGLELRWRPGPFSVKSEYMRLSQARDGLSVEDTDLSDIVASGWYLSGTWVITGENKADGLAAPTRPLLQGGPGAIEVAARVEGLRFRSGATDDVPSTSPRADVILGNANHVTTLGVNWYLNRWVKIQANVLRERIDDPAHGPLPDRSSFWSRVIRFQFML